MTKWSYCKKITCDLEEFMLFQFACSLVLRRKIEVTEAKRSLSLMKICCFRRSQTGCLFPPGPSCGSWNWWGQSCFWPPISFSTWGRRTGRASPASGLTVRRPVVKFHSTARMYMDQSLPGTESVFCFWPVLNPAPQCNFPMALENYIVEPFHGQEFSTNAYSQTWNFPLILYINGIFRWCSFH